MVQISTLLISVLLMGIVLFALSEAFTDVATNYSVSISQNVSNSISQMNSSQSSIMDWTEDNQGSLPQVGDNAGLLTWITGGIFSILTSPISLLGVFINLINAFTASVALATNISVGYVGFVVNSLIAIATLTFIFAIIRSITGKDA